MRLFAGLTAAALIATNAAAADLTVYPPHPTLGTLFRQAHALPECAEPAVLKDIARKFAFGDPNVTHTGLAIVGIDHVRQTGTKDGPSLVDVRYCSATAWFNSGQSSEVVFIIEGPMKGKYSLGYAVESCLPGLDPYRVYDGNCRAIRPAA